MISKKLWLRITSIVITLLILLAILFYLNINGENVSAERLEEIAHDNLIILLILLLIIMFVQNLLNFIPIVVVMSLNVTLLGLWYGYLFSLLTSVTSSTIIFYSFRIIFIDFKANEKYEKYTKKIEKNGFLFVLIARLIPVMPTNVINIAAGLSSIKPRHFIFATLIGNAIYTLLISIASFNIFS